MQLIVTIALTPQTHGNAFGDFEPTPDELAATVQVKWKVGQTAALARRNPAGCTGPVVAHL